MKPVIIVGAGLAGMTVARRLMEQQVPVTVFERERRVGGRCVSQTADGCWFDVAGHFLHSVLAMPPEVQKWLDVSSYGIYDKKAWHETTEDGIRPGLIQRYSSYEPSAAPSVSNLAVWLLGRFGEKVYEEFMRPFNEKMYGHPLTSLSVTELDLKRYPLARDRQYNASFVYPKTGGIQELVEQIWSPMIDLELGTVNKIEGTQVHVSEREWIEGSAVVSTAPIRRFRPERFSLQAPVVTVINGFGKPKKGTAPEDYRSWSWLYTARKETPFWRVGTYCCCGAKPRSDEAIPFYAESSERLGLLRLIEALDFFEWVDVVNTQVVPYAYPVYRGAGHEEAEVIESIKLDEARGQFWCGRYGLDRWYSMVNTLQSAIDCTQRVMKFLQS